MALITSQLYGQQVFDLYEQGSLPAWSFPNREQRELLPEGRELISHVTLPTLTYFKPIRQKGPAPAVIICPGGGYGRLAIGHEGYEVARRLAQWGIAAFVLKYRLPSETLMQGQQHLIPLQDAQQAIYTVRKQAAQWQIDTGKVGIMGFSAGGHLAASAGTHFSKPVALPATAQVRPDAMLLIYPVISFQDSLVHGGSRQNLLGKLQGTEWNNYFSNEKQVTAATPPTFLVHAADDKAVPIFNSLAMAEALQKNKVPHKLVRFERGGHGFGMFNPTSVTQWMDELEQWLQQLQWLPPFTAQPIAGQPAFELAGKTPFVGAEVFIEPGQSAAYIDSLFATLRQHNMLLTRIRLFENYMRGKDGSWDFSLFDLAYKAAEKHGIAIWGNFFPATDYEDVGGFKFPRSRAHLDSVADFIRNAVLHFKQYKSHAGWALLNEIGSGKVPATPLSQSRFSAWKAARGYQPPQAGYRGFGFDEQRFLRDHNTWYLAWLATQVRRYDSTAHLHVNNHALFNLAGEYDFAAWRSVLSSVGGSAHASWHFGYFSRAGYAFAVAANSALLHSGAGPMPWLMTELQGGNNTYSGYNAMCPTKEEITQWIWSVIAGGGKGAIFWSLNPRAGGFEAGEWAMLDYLGQPSDRLKAAGEAAGVVAKNSALLANAKPLSPVVHLLYTPASLWVEEKLQMGGPPVEGRMPGGVMKSVIGYYEALLEMGIPTAISAWEDFDFGKADYTGQVLILAHQIALPADAAQKLEHFVRSGGTLIADGLTGYYDEQARATPLTGFALEKVLGGKVAEYKMEGGKVPVAVGNLLLPGHAWRGYLVPTTGSILAGSNAGVHALQHKLGKGQAFWLPALVGLGSRLHGNAPLAAWLQGILAEAKAKPAVRLQNHMPMVMLQTLETDKGYVTVIINKSGKTVTANLVIPSALQPNLLTGSAGAIAGNAITLQPEATVVVGWLEK
ncbi:MAG: prolyl oligopeptidase family serine peptidase [Chitinophagaceae bacterium]|nr:prolyl oligopeptidase family serine peptidase [Chitinophagaceae bacterium]